MSSIRCPQCGLVNWATSAECKRCALPLDARAQQQSSSSSQSSSPYGGPPPDFGARGGDPSPMFGAQYVCPVCRRPSLTDFCRYCQPAAFAFDAPPPEPQYKSIGGWLILPAAGLVLGPLVLLISIFLKLAMFASPDWAAITSPESPHFIEYFAQYCAAEMLVNVALLVFTLYVAAQFFRKRKSAPKLMMILLGVGLVVMLVDGLAADALFGPALRRDLGIRSPGSGILGRALWMLYFHKSKRVKGTFVN